MWRFAVNAPVTFGVNVTEIVQLVLTARLAPHVVVSAKSLGSFPPITMLEIVSGPVPVLLRVTVCAALVPPTVVLAKERLDGDAPATGTPIPVPVSTTICCEPAVLPALSVTVKTPLRVPKAPGSKVTKTEQLDPAATEPAQLLLGTKSDAFVPLMTMLAMVNAAPPELLRVMVDAALVEPTFWSEKTTVEGANAAAGTPAPVPVSETVCVLPVTLLVLSVIVIVPVIVPLVVGVKVTEIVQLAPTTKVAPQLFVWA
jgi:hypothetical protein